MGLDKKVAAHLLIEAGIVLFSAEGCLYLEPALQIQADPRTEKSAQLFRNPRYSTVLEVYCRREVRSDF